MEQTITCISCPVGCRLKVCVENGEVLDVKGQSCNRGVLYAKQECVSPTRMVTAVLKLKNRSMPLSVKTETSIPKAKISECMREISRAALAAPVKIGQVVCADVCGTGVNVIATKNID